MDTHNIDLLLDQAISLASATCCPTSVIFDIYETDETGMYFTLHEHVVGAFESNATQDWGTLSQAGTVAGDEVDTA